MTNLSVQDISKVKKEFEEIARKNNVTVLYGTAKSEDVNHKIDFIRVKCDSNFNWNEVLGKIGQSTSPFIVMDVYTLDDDDFDSLPDNNEITKEILGENYEAVKKKLKELKALLHDAQIGDITTIIITANVGNYLVQQTYFSNLSDVVFFDLDEFVVDEGGEEKELVKPPSKAEMKKLQESLRQSLLDDPMLLNCSNKSLRQSFLRDKVDELELPETTAYYLLRDSQHIVELAFAHMKKN